MKTTLGKLAGKKGIAEIYNMTWVSPCNIAYVAVLVCFLFCWWVVLTPSSCKACFVLNGQEEWSAEDGKFNSINFFKFIVDLFNKP
jgi:hypothetical protein